MGTCSRQNHRYKAKHMILRNVTLQEANGLLPLVRDYFFRIHVMLAQLQNLRGKLNKKESKRLVLDKNSEAIVVIKKKKWNKKYQADLRAAKEIEARIGAEINDLMKFGVVVKGLVPPHIDFLSVRNSEPICLCWHGGEREIAHWHRLDDQAPARQVISEKSRFGPHMVH